MKKLFILFAVLFTAGQSFAMNFNAKSVKAAHRTVKVLTNNVFVDLNRLFNQKKYQYPDNVVRETEKADTYSGGVAHLPDVIEFSNTGYANSGFTVTAYVKSTSPVGVYAIGANVSYWGIPDGNFNNTSTYIEGGGDTLYSGPYAPVKLYSFTYFPSSNVFSGYNSTKTIYSFGVNYTDGTYSITEYEVI